MNNQWTRSSFYLVLGILLYLFYGYGRSLWHPIYSKIRSQFTNQNTIQKTIQLYQPKVDEALLPIFKSKNISFPPSKICLQAIKDEHVLEVWAHEKSQWIHIKSYSILADSGVKGPKLKEGDGQIPEGIYQIELLNPNSSYHLSMKLNYPNAFDLKHALAEGRNEPGSDIYIHGKSLSIGCLAMGDEAIEELFVLCHNTGLKNCQVIISPSDPRKSNLTPPKKSPIWVNALYEQISRSFKK